MNVSVFSLFGFSLEWVDLRCAVVRRPRVGTGEGAGGPACERFSLLPPLADLDRGTGGCASPGLLSAVVPAQANRQYRRFGSGRDATSHNAPLSRPAAAGIHQT